MIQEFVEIWAWFFGMIAGWGATTIAIVATIVVLFIRQNRMHRRINEIYNRQVAAERECSMRHNKDQ